MDVRWDSRKMTSAQLGQRQRVFRSCSLREGHEVVLMDLVLPVIGLREIFEFCANRRKLLGVRRETFNELLNWTD